MHEKVGENWITSILGSTKMGFPMAQMVKNPPAMLETWVQSLVWEDPLEKGKATHSNILVWRIQGITKSQTQLSDFHFHFSTK